MSGDDAKAERYFPPTYPDEGRERLSNDNREWLAEQSVTLDSLVTMARVRRTNPELVAAVHEAVGAEPGKRRLLRFLAMRGESASEDYDALTAATSASRRSVRSYVGDLEQSGVVERSAGRPTRVAWSRPAAYLITSDALATRDRRYDL